jgi:hypothetical protein
MKRFPAGYIEELTMLLVNDLGLLKKPMLFYLSDDSYFQTS